MIVGGSLKRSGQSSPLAPARAREHGARGGALATLLIIGFIMEQNKGNPMLKVTFGDPALAKS